MFSDVLVVPYSNCPFAFVFPGPVQAGIAEAAVEDEQLASLLDGRARLHESTRCVTRFYDDGSLSQSRHCYVALGKETAVALPILPGISNYRNLADD